MSTSTIEKAPWAAKIAATRKRLKLSQTEFAELLKTTQSNVSKWEVGSYKPSPEMFMRLAKASEGEVDSLLFMEMGGVPPSWFSEAQGQAGMIPSAVADLAVRDAEERRTSEILAGDLIEGLTKSVRSFPLLRDAAAAGTPRTVEDKDIEEVISLPRSWLPRGGSLYGVHVSGDSMAPILKTGDIVIVDIAQRDPRKLIEKMVLARSEDGVTIKWLRRDGDLFMLVPQHTSPAHQVRIIRPESEIEIVGAVVKWIGEPPMPRGKS